MFKIHEKSGYEISDLGKVKKLRGSGFKKYSLSNCGYHVLTLHGKTFYVHRIVWETFMGEIPSGMCINHINGIKTDNRLENLELVTYKENSRHAKENGLIPPPLGAETNPMSKLTNQEYLAIIKMIMAGKSNEDIGSLYNLHPRYISLIRGKKRLVSIWKEYEKQYGEKPVPISGDHSKLSLEQRLDLLNELTDYTNKYLSEKYGLDQSTISHIRRRKTWKKLWAIHDRKSNDYPKGVGSSESKRGAS